MNPIVCAPNVQAKRGSVMQDKKKQSRQDSSEQQTTDSKVDQAKKEGIDQDVDSILDEIDEVLEVEAEAFVKNFIQKGGQ